MDPYADIAAYYDCEHADCRDDIEFYRNMIPAGPVLEVGCGTGRITRPLADEGLELWGVDSSSAMLHRAQLSLAHLPNAHLLHASILDLSLDVRFRTAIWPLNTLWHLPDVDAQLAALRVTRAHLSADGLLLVDCSNPLTLADRGSTGEMRQRFDRVCAGRRVVCSSAAWDDEAEQRLSLRLQYDELDREGGVRRTLTELRLRYTYGSELDLLLRLSGFTVEHRYGTYDLAQYDAASTNLIAVARPGDATAEQR